MPDLPERVRPHSRGDKSQQMTRNGRHITPLQLLECFRVASHGYRMRTRAGDSIIATTSLEIHFCRTRWLPSFEIRSDDLLGVEAAESTLFGYRPV